MKTVKMIFASPAFWIGLCFAILGYLQMVSPKPKPLSEAEQKAHESMMVQFAL